MVNIKIKVMNPYLDINYVDRTDDIEKAYQPTLEDIKADPEYYAELINDLLFHWIYNTRETRLMWDHRNAMHNKADY